MTYFQLLFMCKWNGLYQCGYAVDGGSNLRTCANAKHLVLNVVCSGKCWAQRRHQEKLMENSDQPQRRVPLFSAEQHAYLEFIIQQNRESTHQLRPKIPSDFSGSQKKDQVTAKEGIFLVEQYLSIIKTASLLIHLILLGNNSKLPS